MSATDVVREPNAFTEPPATPRAASRSWTWLALGAALLPFIFFQTILPVAAWLAPVFLLRFARTQRARVALPVLALVSYGATLIALRGFFELSATLVWALGGLAIVLPYAADALATGRLHGVTRSLVFPTVDTAAAFLFSLDQASPFGSWGATGYTQVANLPLTQVTSVVGVYGLSFLILWAAPVVNEAWERRFDLRAARPVVTVFGAVLLAVLLFGGARLVLFPPASPTVPMAALAPDRELNTARNAAGIAAGPRTAEQRADLTRRHLAPVLDDLFARTRDAADAGAKVVAWSEAAGYVFKEDEQAFLDRAAAAARAEGIYLELGIVVILPATDFPQVENRSVLIDPTGEVRWDYDKATLVPGDGNALGPGVLPVVDTPYGRLSVAICFDADFPWLARQAGRAGVDVLLVPSSDWEAPAAAHADMAVVRAVENGVSILRPTRQGISLAIDPQGRTLGRSDYFVDDEQTMIAAVPTRGVPAVYPVVGDVVGWASVAAVLLAGAALATRALRRRVRGSGR
jgi:apolipoprotein N-acyltransferase